MTDGRDTRDATAPVSRRGRSIGHYLGALILVSVLPLLALLAYTVIATSYAEAERAEAQARQMARAIADAMDIESMAMEFSFRFLELRDAAKSLEMGAISDITLKAEYGTVVVRVLSPEYFVAIILGDGSNMGKSRWLLRSNANALNSDLIDG